MFDFIDRCRGDMSLYAKWREDDRSDYIYLDGTDGDDANDGTTEESAVKTFDRREVAARREQEPRHPDLRHRDHYAGHDVDHGRP